MMSKADEIEKLALLRDKGILTEDEFQAEKKRVLDGTDVIEKTRYRDEDGEMEITVTHSSKTGKKTEKTSFNPDNQNRGARNQPSGKSKNVFARYADCIKKYAVFEGRASRAEYWGFFFVNFLVNCLFPQNGVIAFFYSLFIFCPMIGVSVRRLHDTGHSGGQMLFLPLTAGILLALAGAAQSAFDSVLPVLISVVLAIVLTGYLFWLFVKKGDAFPNAYGDIPE